MKEAREKAEAECIKKEGEKEGEREAICRGTRFLDPDSLSHARLCVSPASGIPSGVLRCIFSLPLSPFLLEDSLDCHTHLAQKTAVWQQLRGKFAGNDDEIREEREKESF